MQEKDNERCPCRREHLFDLSSEETQSVETAVKADREKSAQTFHLESVIFCVVRNRKASPTPPQKENLPFENRTVSISDFFTVRDIKMAASYYAL